MWEGGWEVEIIGPIRGPENEDGLQSSRKNLETSWSVLMHEDRGLWHHVDVDFITIVTLGTYL